MIPLQVGEIEDELYDLWLDPRERGNLSGDRPEQVRVFRKELERILIEAARLGSSHSDQMEIDPTLQDRLRALGYVR